MIHNFWSFNYIIQRIKDLTEEYKTSIICPRCGPENTTHAGSFFECLNCGLEAHRDVVGALNMANLHNGETG